MKCIGIDKEKADVMRSCLNCEFFTSFRDDYYDEMEPDDQGFCKNGKSKYFGNEGAGYDVVCVFHNYTHHQLK